MKFSVTVAGLFTTAAFCNPVEVGRAATEDEHPAVLGITSPLYDPSEKPENLVSFKEHTAREGLSIFGRGSTQCGKGSNGPGRGTGWDYDYGCDKGWCWRNCQISTQGGFGGKPWCWLAYEGGKSKTWTPCGRWQDCEWSYNNKNAKCAVGKCKSCGCGC